MNEAACMKERDVQVGKYRHLRGPQTSNRKDNIMTTTFTISSDNNITAFATPEAAQDTLALGALAFTTKKELAKLAGEWPTGRLVELWNGFAGVAPFSDLKPVKKFTDRKTAVGRIWRAVQKLTETTEMEQQRAAIRQAEADLKVAQVNAVATAAPPAADVAPKKAKATKDADTNDGAPTAQGGSKKAAVLEMLRREGGATLSEIAKATDWQNHSIRGFISGTISKKMTLKVESRRDTAGDRVYRITE
jgi:hypothetical protein